jgi:hypothetical protein
LELLVGNLIAVFFWDIHQPGNGDVRLLLVWGYYACLLLLLPLFLYLPTPRPFWFSLTLPVRFPLERIVDDIVGLGLFCLMMDVWDGW